MGISVLIVDSDATPIDQCLKLHVDEPFIGELHVDTRSLATCDLFMKHKLSHIIIEVQ